MDSQYLPSTTVALELNSFSRRQLVPLVFSNDDMTPSNFLFGFYLEGRGTVFFLSNHNLSLLNMRKK